MSTSPLAATYITEGWAPRPAVSRNPGLEVDSNQRQSSTQTQVVIMISGRRVGEGGSQLLERIQDGLGIDSDPEQYDEHCSPQPPAPPTPAAYSPRKPHPKVVTCGVRGTAPSRTPCPHRRYANPSRNIKIVQLLPNLKTKHIWKKKKS